MCNVPFSLEVLERLVDLQGHTSNDNPVVQEMYVFADWVWICMSYPVRVDCMGFDYPVVLPSDYLILVQFTWVVQIHRTGHCDMRLLSYYVFKRYTEMM